MLSSSIIGLFVGAVVLAVGYELFCAWVKGDAEATSEPAPSAAARPGASTPPSAALSPPAKVT